ncbi:MAG: UvrB/UvrC motif-containing protein, partial [Bacillota bacterium]
IKETERRREIQMRYNKEHGIVPKTIIKDIRDVVSTIMPQSDEDKAKKGMKLTKKEKDKVIRSLEKAMREAARKLDFEEAARLRDVIMEIKAGN